MSGVPAVVERLLQLPITHGAVPAALSVGGVGGGVWLLAARRGWFRRWALPACAVVIVSGTLAVYFGVERIWRPIPDRLPLSVYVCVAATIGALTIVGPRLLAARSWRSRLVSVVAAAVVLVAAAANVNATYAQYPTLGDVLGIPDTTLIPFDRVPPPTATATTGWPLDAAWRPPATLPAEGKVTEASIPGTSSGFTARRAWIYLPPAYFTDPRPLLPVLVLLSGQPGTPEDWFVGGKLDDTMNAYAADHAGLAPIVVVADGTGTAWANPLCLDSRLGRVDTYLSVDVPAWIHRNLQVHPDPHAWAIGGLSYGGTCALQIATNHPGTYPTFLDFSGAAEPSLGDRKRTVDAAFGGDDTRFRAVNPADLLKTRRYPGSAGVFTVGAGDDDTRGDQQAMFRAAQNAGMDVRYRELPGGHSWSVWSAALQADTAWLGRRLGLTP